MSLLQRVQVLEKRLEEMDSWHNDRANKAAERLSVLEEVVGLGGGKAVAGMTAPGGSMPVHNELTVGNYAAAELRAGGDVEGALARIERGQERLVGILERVFVPQTGAGPEAQKSSEPQKTAPAPRRRKR